MNKELVTKMLVNNQVNDIDLNTFVSEYTHERLNRDITAQELVGIIQAIKMGFFNLHFALLQAAYILKLNVMSVFDKDGKILRTDVYESF